MADRIADFDWAATPLGPREHWPQSLRTAVELMLALPQPGYIGWGPTLVSLYNDAYVPVLGTKHPGALGRSYHEVWQEIDACYRAALDATLAGRAQMFVDEAMPLAGRGRDTSWFTFSWTPLRDDDGRVAGFLTVGQETSEKVLAELALQESEARATSLVGTLAQATWETDPDGRVAVDSPSWRAYTGQSVQEWLGSGWLDAVHPDDRAYAERQWVEAVAARSTVNAEFRLRHVDGSWRWTNVRAVPLIDRHGVRKWVGMNIDIDAQRSAEIARDQADEQRRVGEARLRAAVEASNIGTFAYNPQQDLGDCDARCCQLMGYDPDAPMSLAQAMAERLHPDDAEGYAAAVYAAVAPGSDGVLAEDFRVCLPDGTLRWLTARGRATFDRPGEPARLLAGTLEDATARKRLEADLAFLAEFERGLALETDPEDIARTATAAIAAHFHAPHNLLVDIEPERELAHIYGDHSAPGGRDLRGDYHLPEFHSAEELARLHAGEPVVLSDVRAQCDPERAAGFAQYGIAALATLPCIRDGRWIFALSVQHNAPHAWDDAEIDLLRRLVERLWLRLERARTDAARREHEAQQAFLLALADALRPLSDPAAIQATATCLLRERFDAGWCYYVEFDEAGRGASVLRDATRPGLPSLAGMHDVSDAPQFMAAMATGELLDVPDYASSRAFSPRMLESYGAIGFRAVLCAPLVKDGHPAGALILGDTEARPWPELAKRLIVDVVERIWEALERANAEAGREVALAAVARQTRFIEGMLGGLPDYAYAFDHGHRFVYANHVMQSLFAWSGASIVGRTFAELDYAPALAARLDAHIDRILATGETVDDEVFYESPGGTRSWFQFTWGPVFDADGRVELVVGTSRDTTARRELEERLRTAEAHHAFRVRVADTLRDLDDPLRIQAEANRLLAEHLGAQRVLFAQMDGETIVIEHDHRDNVASMAGRHPAAAFGAAYLQAFARGEMFMMEDVANDARMEAPEVALIQSMGITAVAAHGIVEDGRLTAIVAVHATRPRRWTEDECALVREVGDRVWAAIKRAQAEQSLRRRQRRDAFLLHLSDRLRRLGDPAQVQSEAARTLGEFLGAARVIYGEVLDDERIRVAHSYVAPGVSRMEGDVRMLDFGAQVIAALLRGEAVVYADLACDPRLDAAERAAYAAVPLRGNAAVPLVKDDRLAAVLAVHTLEPRDWTSEDVQLIEATAERTWAAMNHARAEAAMQHSERRLAAIFSTASVGLSEVGLDGRFLRVNAELCRILGRDADALVGLPVLDVTHPDDIGATLDTIDRARDSGATASLDKRYLRPDGSFVWAHSSATPFRSYGGLPGNLLVVTMDLTERRAAEIAREESERLLRQFSEASSDVLWIRDASTLRWEYLSPAYTAIYGEPLEIALDRNDVGHWSDRIVEQDRDHALASMARVRAGGQATFEYRIQRSDDGAIRWVRDTDFPILDAEGRVHRIGGIGHDVTDLKRVQAELADSEWRQRALMEGIPQLVWRALEGGDWTWSSPQWQAFTGQSLRESLHLGWLDAVHPDDRDATLAAWARAHGAGILDVEFRILRASDGAWLWHHTRSLPQPGLDTAAVEWFGTCTDVQQLKELQQQQQVLVAELQHRTRNLIGVVRSIADRTIAGSTSTDDFRERFRDRMAALARVQGLLSQRDAGQRVTFDQLLHAELGGLGVLDRDAQLLLDGPADIALRSGSVQTFALGLHELATNAVKYGALGVDEGRLHVRWAVEEDPRRGPMLCVDWRESGVHVPAEKRSASGRRGYGRELIERALPYQLQAETHYHLGEDGVHCTIRVPLARRRPAQEVPHG
ncbi:MAG TPA: PAS domain-containing protein [Lysobacter sp.]|nr:PAS domain-containing protein [Lysobacter sp.]